MTPPSKTETKYFVHTRPQGHWLAGFRHRTEENPIPVVELHPNPVHFWNSVEAAIDVSQEKALQPA